ESGHLWSCIVECTARAGHPGGAGLSGTAFPDADWDTPRRVRAHGGSVSTGASNGTLQAKRLTRFPQPWSFPPVALEYGFVAPAWDVFFQLLGFSCQPGAVRGQRFKNLVGNQPMSQIVGMDAIVMHEPVGVAITGQEIDEQTVLAAGDLG